MDVESESIANTNDAVWNEGSSLYETNPFNEPLQGPISLRKTGPSRRG